MAPEHSGIMAPRISHLIVPDDRRKPAEALAPQDADEGAFLCGAVFHLDSLLGSLFKLDNIELLLDRDRPAVQKPEQARRVERPIGFIDKIGDTKVFSRGGMRVRVRRVCTVGIFTVRVSAPWIFARAMIVAMIVAGISAPWIFATAMIVAG